MEVVIVIEKSSVVVGYRIVINYWMSYGIVSSLIAAENNQRTTVLETKHYGTDNCLFVSYTTSIDISVSTYIIEQVHIFNKDTEHQ